MASLPNQKVSHDEKIANDYAWAKDTIKAWIDRADFNTKRKTQMYRLYDFYNGIQNPVDYTYITDPYKSRDTGTVRKFPAKLRSYNIIKPVIDLLLGEKAKRSLNYQVVVKNPDVVNKYEEYRTQQYLSYLQQAFVNKLNERGVDTGIESRELPSPEEFKQQVETSYRDKRAIMGQQSMDYIIARTELDDKFQDGFFDWLVTGEVYSYKDTLFNEVDYEIVSPMDIFYEASSNVKFIEDGDMAGQRKLMSVSEVIDMFHDVLTDDEIDRLEQASLNQGQGFNISFILRQDDQMRDNGMKDRLVEVYHVNWKAYSRVGFLEVPDGMGGTKVIRVSEDYKPLPDETIEWHWVSEVWEGYQIDGDIYKHVRPIKEQRNELSNKSSCKLKYNGTSYSNRNTENRSIVEMGIPYQILYNVFHYRMELSIAKNKDKIALIEMNTVPKRHGWDEEKFMYMADALGFAFIDSTATGKNAERVNFNQYQVLDMSLGQYISAQFELLQAIKMEWEELLGITRQRKGQIMASDGAANSQAAIGQSSVMTSEIFRKYGKFEERDMQGLLDLSKHAWKEGKQETYVTSDFRSAILNILPEDIQEADLGLFLKDSTKESEKLQALKQFAFQFAQNGSQPSTIADILDDENFASIKEKVKKVEAAQKAWEEKMKQMESQGIQQAEQIKAQSKKEEMDQKERIEDKKIASAEKIAREKNELEYAKLADQGDDDSSIDWAKIAVDRESIASKERIADKQIAAQKQIAKDNKRSSAN